MEGIKSFFMEIFLTDYLVFFVLLVENTFGHGLFDFLGYIRNKIKIPEISNIRPVLVGKFLDISGIK